MAHGNHGELGYFMGTVYCLGTLIIGMFIFCLVTPRKGGIKW